MKIIAISDTHGKHADLKLPEGDVLIHAGDFSKKGTLQEVANFAIWMGKQKFKRKILISGNHELGLDPNFSTNGNIRPILLNLFKENNIEYLENSRTMIGDLVVYGSPIVPKFHNWAWMRSRGAEINKYWHMIPDNVNILITHGPPLGILDVFEGESCGCNMLLHRVKELKHLKAHIFGHIHSGYGQIEVDGIKFNNAASCGMKYEIENLPLIIEV